MRLEVFAIYDRAVQLYLQPIFMRSSAEAVRAVRLSLREPQGFALSPRDYALFHLGSYEERTGLLDPLANPELVVELVALVERKEEANA